MIQLQVTLFDKSNKYKPISTIVKVESISYYKEHSQEVRHQAIVKICQNIIIELVRLEFMIKKE